MSWEFNSQDSCSHKSFTYGMNASYVGELTLSPDATGASHVSHRSSKAEAVMARALEKNPRPINLRALEA